MTGAGGALTIDTAVRLHIMRHFHDAAAPPSVGETARALGYLARDVEEAYHRLAAGRAIVLRPGTSSILMAAPYSAVPTRFRVEVGERAYWANCVWDALGIPAMLRDDARVLARCGDCDDPLTLIVEGDVLAAGGGVVHFAVPARRWWDDIVFT